MRYAVLPLGSLALLLALQACVTASPNDEPIDEAVASLTATPFASISECVDAHIAAACDNASEVRRLACPQPRPATCATPSDLSALSRLPNLRELDLSGRCIRDLAPIAALTGLHKLELADNDITSMRALGSLERLVYLGLANNPVESTWGYVSREPFSHFSHLQELVLDGSSVDNILPLAQAKKLRVLSLRNVITLDSIRPLVSMTQLRVLHIDGSAFVNELEPLADMIQLEELTADGTLVSSVAPVHGLPRLRSVSLAGSCVRSCDGFTHASVDCSAPMSESDCDFDANPLPATLGVPVEDVARFVPPNLPVWSDEQIAYGFERARTAPDIDWQDARGNCDGRAFATEALFESLGLPGIAHVMSFGNLRMLTQHDPAGYYYFDWHTAVVVRSTTGFLVIDPALDETAPMPIERWFARQVDARDAALDFSCEHYGTWTAPGRCAGTDNVDAQGNFLVDDVALLRGAIFRYN